MSFRLRIPRGLYEQMIAQAKAEWPCECCGVLAAPIAAKESLMATIGERTATACFPLKNAIASPAEYFSEPTAMIELVFAVMLGWLARVEYLSDPRTMFEADRDMRRRGLDVVAIYHSHPSSDPIPSRKDLERNYYGENVMHLIVSLESPEPIMRGWWLGGGDFREAECIVTSDEQSP
jgi:proteasome lid subunit RPN8/RPN11